MKPRSIELSYVVPKDIDREVLKDLLTLEVEEKHSVKPIGLELTSLTPSHIKKFYLD